MDKHGYNIFPEMNAEDYSRLLLDIKVNGFDKSQPIYLYEGKILDGWNRQRVCNELNIKPEYKEFVGLQFEAIQFVMRTNKRRNLTSSQWAAIAAEADELWDILLKQVQEDKAEKNRVAAVAQHSGLGNKLPNPANRDSNKASQKIAESFNTNRTYVSDAKKYRETNPDYFEAIKSGEKSITEIKRQEKKDQQQERFEQLKQKELKEPDGVYDVVVIDPPWEMEKIKREVAPLQIGFDYRTKTIDEIKEIKLPAAETCHVFLWITHKHLPHGFDILKAWNVKYVCCFVWHKNGGFQPFGLPQYNCEFVLYGRIGTPEFIDLKQFSTCFSANRTGHSQKPEEFYDVIRRVTGGHRIDYFSRRQIKGFDSWGDEA